jgi:hypothetical protein
LLFQGVIRDEGDLNMLGGDFKNAYKAVVMVSVLASIVVDCGFKP